MIYEVRTQDVRPGCMDEVLKRFEETYEKRKQYSPLAAFWYTDIGPINQIIHVWPYKDVAERMRIRDECSKAKVWPPKLSEFLVNSTAEIMNPLKFSPEMKPGKMGPYFEMRIDMYGTAELHALMHNWEAVLDERLKLSPLCGVWYSEFGVLNRLMHIWPYQSLDQRRQVLDKAKAVGIWPPELKAKAEGAKVGRLDVVESKLLLASSFSPLQ